MSIWFTSDQHFDHANVIKYCNRPFATVEEMNAELIRRHNVKQMRMMQEYHAAGFDEIMLSGKMEIGGVTVLLNHMPYSGDTHESEDRYKKYRPVDTGGWLLHGHVHQHWMKRGKQINVGVDVWAFAPVSEEELVGIITGNEGY